MQLLHHSRLLAQRVRELREHWASLLGNRLSPGKRPSLRASTAPSRGGPAVRRARRLALRRGIVALAWAQGAAAQPAPESRPSQPPADSAPTVGAPVEAGPARADDAPVGVEAKPGSYRFQSDVVCPFCALTPEFPHGRAGLHWHDHWEATGSREWIAVSALAATTLALRTVAPGPSRAHWQGPVLFDAAARDALRIRSASGRRTAAGISDALFVWEVLHPTVLDPLLVAWWQRRSPLVAWQMFVIDAQAYALTLLLSDLVKRASSRQRPWVSTDDCAEDPSGPSCGSGGRYQSFYSGHSAVTATGAGLICAHHTQLSLYQSDFLDQGTCVLAVLGTALTGAMRIASDNHWASDVLMGHLMGYASGYLMPTLLYYREFRSAPHDHPPGGPSFATLPLVQDGALGLSVFGAF